MRILSHEQQLYIVDRSLNSKVKLTLCENMPSVHTTKTGVHADYDSASKHSPYKPVDLGFNPWNCRMDMPYKNYNWTHRQMSDKHLLILAENYF